MRPIFWVGLIVGALVIYHLAGGKCYLCGGAQEGTE